MSPAMLIIGTVSLYVIGAFFVGLPLAQKSIDVWRKGVKYRRFEGKNVKYSGGFWGFVLFPKSAFNECVGLYTSKPWGMRLIGLGTRKKRRLYLILMMVLWLPRIVFNACVLALWLAYGAVLTAIESDNRS